MAAGTGFDISLKEDYGFLILGPEGTTEEKEHGLYHRDTRFLSRYSWDFGPGFRQLLSHVPTPDTLTAHSGLFENFSQVLAVRRTLRLYPDSADDVLVVENSGSLEKTVTLTLETAADFSDLFEVRGFFGSGQKSFPLVREDGYFSYAGTAPDGFRQEVRLYPSEPPARVEEGKLTFTFTVAAGTFRTFSLRLKILNEASAAYGSRGETGTPVPLPSYESWRASFRPKNLPSGWDRVYSRAVLDMRALLLSTAGGPYPTAGIPWYAAAFGRDGILTAYMLLPWRTDVAEGVLRYLALHQGKKEDAFRAESPGKIMHEIRYGELARRGTAPHSPYYGTLDATPLFIILLHETWVRTGNDALVRELAPAWQAALAWMTGPGDPDGDGFLEYRGAEPGPGKGLVVQSWKDSEDSMSHADGSLAFGLIAPVEVQGYAVRAYRAAGEFCRLLGDSSGRKQWEGRAAALSRAIVNRFRLPRSGMFAMALDGEKRPLSVLSSNPGHLLWSGAVDAETARRLVETLMSGDLWSGWGLRTLGKREKRYNPLSYHNGSVWPHDTAMTAEGFLRYGFSREASRIRTALFELAMTQPDLRLPELVAGYDREDAPPIPYPTACRPQAWDAAAALFLASLELEP